MNNYAIKMKNEKEALLDERIVARLSFPEAVMYANNEKNKLGHRWEIISISKKEKEKRHV
tara:strand:- start:914 stop:1093 length:180 start_codon:yes stop_codon:yes gene_type:complete